jgi:hypothetical protein
MRTVLIVVALMTFGVLAMLWWRAGDPEDVANTVEVVPASITPASPVPAATTAPTTASAPVSQARGRISFGRSGSGETLDLPVAGGVALWDAPGNRLRVLLTDEALSPAEQRQMAEYLRDDRLADAGRRYGLLELRFPPGTTTPDRNSLSSASLTVGSAGDVVRDTTDVLSSIQWSGSVRPSPDAQPLLQLASTSRAHPGNAGSHQDWDLAVSVPVIQLSRP